MLGLEEMLGTLDAEGFSGGPPVGRSEVLRASLGTLVGLLFTEGAANALGAADLLGAEDTLGALEVEGPNESAPAGPPEALKRKFKRQAEVPL